MNNGGNKFFLQCKQCGVKIKNFSQWFKFWQKCPECEAKRVDVVYATDIENVKKLIASTCKPESVWHYFDFLPLHAKKNVVTKGEGIVPINRWAFLEEYAKQIYRIDCQVYAHRHDDNYATGTFKDIAGTVVASVLKENNIKAYVVASTGNTGAAFSHYLAMAGISLFAFIPQDALKTNETEIGSYGQRVFRVNGDYTRTKALASEFSQKYGILLSAGNYDPLRIEAKKTMVFEWLRIMEKFPTVYIQALSGGTGPLAIEKACDDLQALHLIENIPRFILVQPEKCAPMATAWAEAKSKGFPAGWEHSYPVYTNPGTSIPTLATGNPTTYPAISKLVRRSKGEIIDFNEEKTIAIARLVAYETTVRPGPAAAIAVGGFLKALHNGHLRNGDVVLINVGEGIRRAPLFLKKLQYTSEQVDSLDTYKPLDRSVYRDQLWKPFENNGEL